MRFASFLELRSLGLRQGDVITPRAVPRRVRGWSGKYWTFKMDGLLEHVNGP